VRTIVTVSLLAILCLMAAGCKKVDGAAAEASDSPSSAAVTEADLHPCDVTGTALTLEDCAAAGRWLDESKQGTAAFNAPTRMIQGQTKMVTLAVGTQAPPPPSDAPADTVAAASDAASDGAQPAASDAEPSLAEAGRNHHAKPHVGLAEAQAGPSPHEVAVAASPGGKVVDYYPFVGHQMAADLEGEGFQITPLSPRVQPVVDGAVTTWSWKVTAREFGQKPLIMKTTVVMTDSHGHTQPLKPTSDPKIVNVIIGPLGVIDWLTTGTNGLKALAAFLAALAAVFAAWKALKSKPKVKSKAQG